MIIVAGSHTEILEDTVKHLADARMGRKRHTTTAYTLDEIEWSNPGVVITNLKFEGIEFVRRIRRKNKKQYREVPILALIEDATRDRIIDLLKAGVSDILLCPYDPADLRKRAMYGRDASYAGILREVDSDKVRNLPDIPTQNDLNDLLLKEDVLKDLEDPLIRVQKREEERRKAREQPSGGKRSLITYDFKHPSRVNKEQTRTLENLHYNLARMMAASFSTFARQIVDVDIAFVDQTTYAEFIQSLSNPSVSYTYTIDPLGGPAILDFSTPVAYAFIERQFGGTGGRRPGERRPLTHIERSVMSAITTRALADLEATWEPLLKIRISDAELETNPGGDPNWPREVDARLSRIGDAEMDIAVLLGRKRMPLEEVLNAEPGTVYDLEKPAGMPMEILVNGTLFGYGEIVVVGDRLAIRIVQLLKPGEMKDF